MGHQSASETIRAYYAALREGEPLAQYFAADDAVVKVGISERLRGYDQIAAGLREQTAHTDDWTVESRDLQVIDRESYAWFSDVVGMEWTDTDDRTRHAYESHWSGTLEARDRWVFVGMHVSAPHEL